MLSELMIIFYWPIVALSIYLFLKTGVWNFKQATRILSEVIRNKGVAPKDPILDYRQSLAVMCFKWSITWSIKIALVALVSVLTYLKFSQQ